MYCIWPHSLEQNNTQKKWSIDKNKALQIGDVQFLFKVITGLNKNGMNSGFVLFSTKRELAIFVPYCFLWMCNLLFTFLSLLCAKSDRKGFCKTAERDRGKFVWFSWAQEQWISRKITLRNNVLTKEILSGFRKKLLFSFIPGGY